MTRTGILLVTLLLLGACVGEPTAVPKEGSIDDRIGVLEARVEGLEKQVEGLPRETPSGSRQGPGRVAPSLEGASGAAVGNIESERVAQPAAPAYRAAPDPQAKVAPGVAVEVVEISSKSLDDGSHHVKFPWILRAANRTGYPVMFHVRVLFLDSGGFEIERDFKNNLRLGANETGTFQGSRLIERHLATKVQQVKAEVMVK